MKTYALRGIALVVALVAGNASADSVFNFRKGVDENGNSFVGTQKFALKSGKTRAVVSINGGTFSRHALPLTPRQKGLGVKSRSDERPHWSNPTSVRESIKIRFNRPVYVNVLNIAPLRGSNLAAVSTLAGSRAATQSVALTSDPLVGAFDQPVRKLSLRFVGDQGAFRLAAIRTSLKPITNGGGDDDDDDDNGNGGGGNNGGGGGGGGGGSVVIPLPNAAYMGLPLLGALGLGYYVRARRGSSSRA